MKLKYIFLPAIIFFSLIQMNAATKNFSSKKEKQETICAAFYNCENFFDTLNDVLVDDAEFLPTSKNKWTSERYKTKVNHIAKVISSLNNNNAPDVIGLSEIENENVLNDLVADEQLKSFDYGIVHFDSPDKRGIDVALLYKKKNFTVVDSKVFQVKIDSLSDFKTRQILMVKGIVADDTVYVFVNHWPSRLGGAEKSESKRIAAAKELKKHVDEIFQKQKDAQIIIVGDFNDNPENKSINQILGADSIPEKTKSPYLFNASFYQHHTLKNGTLEYKNNWDLFDQLIISGNLAKVNSAMKNGEFDAYKIFKPDWLLHQNKYNETEPFRTFSGGNYIGGYSDHLPVFAVLNLD